MSLGFARRTSRGMGSKAVSILCGVLAMMALVSLGFGGEAEVNAVQVRRLEEKPTKEGVAMAATLLGSISFIMCLYYFINYDDKDIKQKSWETISSTISIFCAVLLWSSFNDLAETYVIEPLFGEGETSDGALAVDIVHMLCWTAQLQLALGWLSRATGPFQVNEAEMEKLEADDELMEEQLERVEINMACFAVLLAHITGFATINAFGTIQQKYFASSPLVAFLAVPLAFLGQLVIQRITDTIREKISLGDDGIKDEFEKTWDEEAEEAENDVMGLTLSFLIINSMRFALTGCLPNQEGKEEECPKATGWEDGFLYHHTAGQKWSLVACGLLFTGLVIVVRLYFPEWLEESEIEAKYKEGKAEMIAAGSTPQEAHAKCHPVKHKWAMIGRLAEGCVVALSMCFSWSVFYGFQMVLASHPAFEGQPQLLAVVLALVISLPLMFGLIPLDALADQDWTTEKHDKAIRGIMDAMALTIGFAWEQCFDACVDAIAVTQGEHGLINVHSTKLALTIFCAGLLVPAWYWYILPFMVQKGWKYGYVLGPSSLADVAAKIQQELENDDLEGAEEEKEEQRKKKKKKLKKVAEVLTTRLEQIRARLVSQGEETTEGGMGVDTTSYKALPGDDVGALKQKNTQLAAELEKARAAGLKCQQMLDQTMENMFSSLKVMNVTVSKIEESNGR